MNCGIGATWLHKVMEDEDWLGFLCLVELERQGKQDGGRDNR